MKLQYRVNLVSAAEVLPLRQRILRPFATIDECVNPEDRLASTFHLGLYHGSRLVSVGTFMLQPHPDFSSGFPHRLRGMATDETFRGCGFGRALLREGIEILRSRRCDLLWFNARVRAFPFYEKMGFHFHGPLFEMKDIGPHKVMYKHLIPR